MDIQKPEVPNIIRLVALWTIFCACTYLTASATWTDSFFETEVPGFVGPKGQNDWGKQQKTGRYKYTKERFPVFQLDYSKERLVNLKYISID